MSDEHTLEESQQPSAQRTKTYRLVGFPTETFQTYLNRVDQYRGSWSGEERRATEDRRGKERSGKWDRRRNRCATCAQYGTQDSGEGWCQAHQKPMAATDFACVQYQGR